MSKAPGVSRIPAPPRAVGGSRGTSASGAGAGPPAWGAPPRRVTLHRPKNIKESIKETTFIKPTSEPEQTTNRTYQKLEKERTFDVSLNHEKTFTLDKEYGNEKGNLTYTEEKIDLCKLTQSLGCRVSVSESKSLGIQPLSGVLKYVGRIQSDDGFWCGIETETESSNYHNGFVDGVKYFSCRDGHGVLVPAANVQVNPAIESSDFKIKELKSRLESVRSKTSQPANEGHRPNVIDITQHLVDDGQGESNCDSGPYGLLVGLVPDNLLNSTQLLDCSKMSRLSSVNAASTPIITKTNADNSKYEQFILSNALRVNDNRHSLDAKLIEDESMLSLSSMTTNESKLGNVENKSFMLGEITKTSYSDGELHHQKCTPMSKIKGVNSPQHRTTEEIVPLIEDESIISFQLINCETSPRRLTRTSILLASSKDSEVHTPTELLNVEDNKLSTSTPFSENVTDEIYNIATPSKQIQNDSESINEAKVKQFVLGPMTRRTNSSEASTQDNSVGASNSPVKVSKANMQSKENRRSKISVSSAQDIGSPTVSDNSTHVISKQNSFDESLGILTPDQMDSMSFLDNMCSPSRDDIVGIMDNKSQLIEKNELRIEYSNSTDNSKCLTPDGVDYLLPMMGRMKINDSNRSRTVSSENLDSTVLEKTMLDTSGTTDKLGCAILERCATEEDVIEIDDFEKGANDTYDQFVQLPFKQSTAENLLCSEVCIVATNQANEDELLPSVHSSILDPLSSVVDTTVNLDLPLDSRRYDNVHQPATNRMDQTPSPEELPLDPIGSDGSNELSINQLCNSIIQEQSQADSETKTDTTKSVTSKVSNSFITSITSITSLDGYQGDGEMSRPVSRGADQSPTIGHRAANNLQHHWQNIPINRRADPMTDSDFFTESDADGHDEQSHRRAQVIDGALYGGGRASNPPVLVSRNSNNDDSCMESSGVFTDLETHRCSPILLNVIDDLSPDGSSPSTRSELSQKNNNSGIFYNNISGSPNDTIVALESSNQSNPDSSKESLSKTMKQTSPHCSENKLKSDEEMSPVSNVPNEKMKKEDENLIIKKYKMPRRDVASKVKSMLRPTTKPTEAEEKRPSPKSKIGRWDAVMNKISVNKSEAKPASYLKDVKSKVRTSTRCLNSKGDSFEDNPETSESSSRKPRMAPSKLKSRRVRSRLTESLAPGSGSTRSSPHSSQSDVSISGPSVPNTPPNKHQTNRSAKKRDGSTVRGGGVPPAVGALEAPPAASQTAALQATAPKVTRPPSSRPQQVSPHTRQNASTVKKPVPGLSQPGGGRVMGASGRSPLVPAAPPPLSGGNPARKGLTRRATPPASGRNNNNKAERECHPAEVVHLKYAKTLVEAPAPSCAQQGVAPPHLTAEGGRALLPPPTAPPPPQPPPTRTVEALAVLVQYLVFKLDALHSPAWQQRAKKAEARGTELQDEVVKLQGEREANDALYSECLGRLRGAAEEQLHAALKDSEALKGEIQGLKSTLEELKSELSAHKEALSAAERMSRSHEVHAAALQKELKLARQEVEDMKRNTSFSKESTLQAEAASLKVVLELKQEELMSLRRQAERLQSAADLLPAETKRADKACARAEELQELLDQRNEQEGILLQRNKQLQESFTHMSEQKNRLSLHNEELQYKLMQSTEVVNMITARAFDSSLPGSPRHDYDRLNKTVPKETFVRGHPRISASFNEKYLQPSAMNEWRSHWTSSSMRSDSSDTRSEHLARQNMSVESLHMSEGSPSNSPKIKSIVEKSDSVSWVVEIEEPAEEIVSRLVRKASSFRMTSSPPAREALKRQRSRPRGNSPPSPIHPLAQSASASSLMGASQRNTAQCKLFRSSSSDKQIKCVSSTPQKERRSAGHLLSKSVPLRQRASSFSHEDRQEIEKSLQHRERSSSFTRKCNSDLNEALSDSFDAESLVSNGDLGLLQECEAVPKESAGEALISGANSEDDSLDERSQSSTDSESGSDSHKYLQLNGAGERLADPVLQKIAEDMEKSLAATPMEVSWSEECECLMSESDI